MISQTPEQKKGFQIRCFNKGEVIFREGHSAKEAYLIRSGKVGIYKNMEGRRLLIAHMVAGQILGEMAIITGEPRSATAQAAEFCELLVMDKKSLHNALDETLPIIKALLNQLIVRINNTDQKNLARAEAITDNQRRVAKLERALRTIHAEAADWLLARPKGDAASRQWLQRISVICQETLRP